MGAESQTKNVPDNHSNFGTFTTPQHALPFSALQVQYTELGYLGKNSRQLYVLSILKGKAHGTETYLFSPTNRVNCFSCLNFILHEKCEGKCLFNKKADEQLSFRNCENYENVTTAFS